MNGNQAAMDEEDDSGMAEYEFYHLTLQQRIERMEAEVKRGHALLEAVRLAAPYQPSESERTGEKQ